MSENLLHRRWHCLQYIKTLSAKEYSAQTFGAQYA